MLRTLTYHLHADEERGVYGLEQRSPAEEALDLLMTLAISALLALSAVEAAET